jgi:hypothetical protein
VFVASRIRPLIHARFPFQVPACVSVSALVITAAVTRCGGPYDVTLFNCRLRGSVNRTPWLVVTALFKLYLVSADSVNLENFDIGQEIFVS